jgi:3-methylfumaryl-CoA hydratase
VSSADGPGATHVLERTDLLLPWSALAFAGLIGVQAPDVENGEPLPLLWHWLYLLEHPPTEDLGEDGHAVRGVIPVPAGAGQRRMIAGGRVRRLGDLRCGEEATRRTRIVSTVDKVGRSGPMTFVAVRHEIHQRGRLVVEERQDVVYRGPGRVDPAGHASDAPRQQLPAAGWVVDTSPSLLFRFSALTYNAHRIHYDRTYAQQVEGYPGLVVHGPLQAMLMTEAARSRHAQPRLAEFSFRLVAPVFDHEGLVVTAGPAGSGAEDVETTVHSGGGRLTATGVLTGSG